MKTLSEAAHNDPVAVVAARATYKAIRASVIVDPANELNAREFDALARHIVHEDTDGEDVYPSDWTRAARDIEQGRR